MTSDSENSRSKTGISDSGTDVAGIKTAYRALGAYKTSIGALLVAASINSYLSGNYGRSVLWGLMSLPVMADGARGFVYGVPNIIESWAARGSRQKNDIKRYAERIEEELTVTK